MNKLTKILASFAFVFALAFTFNSLPVDIDIFNNTVMAEEGLPEGNVITDADTRSNTHLNSITGKIYDFAKIFSGLVLAVAVVFIVFAGFRYITSGGDQRQMEQAKLMIISAGIGIFISLSAFVILRFFLSASGAGA